ncbi:MAG: hypothetical protein HRU15_11260 [Planctomycetes bacterium]|nr:hypothetical protein [Planctomycetota bacterium]
MRRILLLVAIASSMCLLQSCGSYHRISTGNNVSIPVPVPAGTLPTS